MSLDGKVAVVTGAASGIGLAMVKTFTEAGAHVVAVDIAAPALEHLRDWPGVLTLVADMADRSGVAEMMAAALKAHDHVDILCNNAGVPDLFQGAGDCTDEEWDRSLAVNLTAAFLASRIALQHMVPRGSGVIINTGSVASFRGGEAGVAYTAAKHGLIGLTRSIAAMYAQDGIRCVAICPGPVSTGITKINAARREAGLIDMKGQEMSKRTAALRWRWADPGEIAALALFLASDAGSAMNGCAIPADSGRMAY
jgi:NAD(P)-dependent dehydrogenase (short-subunit alcohol dehydrogenase family)